MLHINEEHIIRIIELFLFFLLMSRKASSINSTHKYMNITLPIVQTLILFFCNYYGVSGIITITLFVLLHAILWGSFRNHLYIFNLFWVFLYIILLYTAEGLTIMIPITFFHVPLSSVLASGVLCRPFSIVYITILTISVILLIHLHVKTFYLKTHELILLIILSCFAIEIEQAILLEHLYMTTQGRTYHTEFLPMIFFLFLFLLITLIIFVYNLGITRNRNIELIRQQALSKIERTQYEQILDSVSELRKLKHDIHNHLDVLSAFVSHRNYNELESYIKEINHTLEQSHYAVSTGNTAVDCIVTNKLNTAKNYGIEVDYTLHLPPAIPLSDVEICSLLGNLFDNAIEHCKDMNSRTDKHIKINIKPFNNMLTITMENSADGIYLKDSDGNLISRKQDDSFDGNLISEHGIGLIRVKEISEQHDGFIDIETEDDIFTVSVMIPLK